MGADGVLNNAQDPTTKSLKTILFDSTGNAIQMLSEKDAICHNADAIAGDGTIIDVTGYSKIRLESWASVAGGTVTFYVAGKAGSFQLIEGYHPRTPSDGILKSSITTVQLVASAECLEFDVEGESQFKAVTTVSSNNISVKGKLIP